MAETTSRKEEEKFVGDVSSATAQASSTDAATLSSPSSSTGAEAEVSSSPATVDVKAAVEDLKAQDTKPDDENVGLEEKRVSEDESGSPQADSTVQSPTSTGSRLSAASMEQVGSIRSRSSSLETETPGRSSSEQVRSSMDTGRSSFKIESPTTTISSQAYSLKDQDYCTSPVQTPTTPIAATSPTQPGDPHISMDSMQSIVLSDTSLEYDKLSADQLSADQVNDVLATPRANGHRHVRKPSSLEILQNNWMPQRQSTLFDNSKVESSDDGKARPGEERDDGLERAFVGTAKPLSMRSGQSGTPSVNIIDTSERPGSKSSSLTTPTRGSMSSGEEETEVDWQALDKNEEQEKEDKEIPAGAEDDSTSFLLARLEQENAKHTADPKSASAPTNKSLSRVRSKSRPPSMAHLKKLVTQQQETPSIRYSLASEVEEQLPEEPPPMTELEFWAALVQDYTSTASRLPTLTTTKIRAGIPPPLRGVVWTSMSGARDKSLEQSFEKLQGEKSPYEGIINKDVGRSFPGVELFRDAEGEGQKSLGRVLKCFSLHDKDIGYCQGLGFLVGPLLMNMGEREAFCVLVRLMDHYALRPSFLPSLSGLHMRIFQFSTLLAQHHPKLSDHLVELGVEPAYLSQWFLSCFAVTCPLPMLFRIYDVIFAEGANETVMRVALALFRRNEAKMLASTEFEEVMQLLLGRQLWDVYGCNADELVDDFTSLGHIITHQRLAELEREFETKDGETVGQSAGFLPDVQAAASRFLGRLWAPSHNQTPSKASATLSPPGAEKEQRPGFLRRSTSKQSLSTVTDSNSSESPHVSIASTTPTDQEIHDAAVRESRADAVSLQSKAGSVRTLSVSQPFSGGVKEQQELHSQIEDLLMALGELQREHARLAGLLQREREEREEDQRVVKLLVGRLRKDDGSVEKGRRSMPPPARPRTADATGRDGKRRTLPSKPRLAVTPAPDPRTRPNEVNQDTNEVKLLVEQVHHRLETHPRLSTAFETKAQLRNNLVRTRDQLLAAEAQAKDLTARAEFSETSLMTFQSESDSLRSEVEELRLRVNDDYKEKKKLEMQIQKLETQSRIDAKRERQIKAESESGMSTPTPASRSDAARKASISSAPGGPSNGGLRELKLGRRDSGQSVQSLRSMKSQRPDVSSAPSQRHENTAPPSGAPAGSTSTFNRRTSSLAAQAVFATPQHEPVGDEAMLLELVNAKTSEAQARQEVDELKKSLAIQKRKAEEAASLAEKAKDEMQKLKSEAEKTSAKDGEEGKCRGLEAPEDDAKAGSTTPPKTETPPPPATGGGWFWNRRAASNGGSK